MVCVAASTCLALFVCFISANFMGRQAHLGEVISQQFSILQREQFTFNGGRVDVWELRNRILVPILLAGLSHVILPTHAFLVIRLATAWLMFFAFFTLMGDGRRWQPLVLTVGFLLYVLLISFAHDFEHPFDFPDVMFAIVFIWAMLLAVIVATLNRESSAFAGVIWWCLYRQRGSKDVLYAAGISAGAYAFALWIRSHFILPGPGPLRNRITLFSIPRILRETDITLFAWPMLLLLTAVPVLWWLWDLRETFSWQERRLIIAGVLIMGITLLFGVPWEPRVLLPGWTVFICAGTMAERRRWA